MAIKTRGIKFQDLEKMTKQERDACFKALFNPVITLAQAQEEQEYLEEQIYYFEERYKMSSEAMEQEVLTGNPVSVEAADLSRWRMLLEIRCHCRNQVKQ